MTSTPEERRQLAVCEAAQRRYVYSRDARAWVREDGARVTDRELCACSTYAEVVNLFTDATRRALHQKRACDEDEQGRADAAIGAAMENLRREGEKPVEAVRPSTFTARTGTMEAAQPDPLASAYHDIRDRAAAVRGGLALLSAEWDRTRPQVRAILEAERAVRRAWWRRVAWAVAVGAAAMSATWVLL